MHSPPSRKSLTQENVLKARMARNSAKIQMKIKNLLLLLCLLLLLRLPLLLRGPPLLRPLVHPSEASLRFRTGGPHRLPLPRKIAAIAAGSFLFITGAAHTAEKKVNSEACTGGWVADGTAGNGGEEMAEVLG